MFSTNRERFQQMKMRRKKNVKKGVLFSLMVCGASGTGTSFSTPALVVSDPSAGRTTFVNTLCGKKVLQSKDSDDAANAHLEEGVRIKPVTVGRSNRSLSQKEVN